MRQVFSLKKLFVFMLCGILSLSLIGCRDHKAQDQIRLGEYVHEIITRARIDGNIQETPYYLNIQQDNPYFTDVQKAVEWGVLEQSIPFDDTKL